MYAYIAYVGTVNVSKIQMKVINYSFDYNSTSQTKLTRCNYMYYYNYTSVQELYMNYDYTIDGLDGINDGE